MAPRFLCGFFIWLPALLLVPGEANKLAGQVPGCDGCGGDNGANECWTTCGGARGYCSKCNSAQGTLGACCAQGNADDKDECKLAVGFKVNHTKFHECVLVQVPECVGCGNRENECWNTCDAEDGNPRGYCAKCNSAQGTRGACCAQGNADDPDECKRAVGFAPDRSYHECVLLVPTATTTTTTLHTATVPRCARMPNVMLNKLQEMGFDAIAPPKEDCR